jgi:hypothetical protein
MRKATLVVAIVVLVAGIAMSVAAVVAVGEGSASGCQSGPMDLDESLASESVIGVARQDALADRVGLGVWAPGSVAKVTAVWGTAADGGVLVASGGRFNAVPAGSEGCATQAVDTSRYSIVYRSGDGPHPFAVVDGDGDEAQLTQRFGQPAEDPIGMADRLIAIAALSAGPVVTIGLLLVVAAVVWMFVGRATSTDLGR